MKNPEIFILIFPLLEHCATLQKIQRKTQKINDNKTGEMVLGLPAQVGPSYSTGQTHFTSPLVNSHFPPFLQGFLFSPFFGKQ